MTTWDSPLEPYILLYLLLSKERKLSFRLFSSDMLLNIFRVGNFVSEWITTGTLRGLGTVEKRSDNWLQGCSFTEFISV